MKDFYKALSACIYSSVFRDYIDGVALAFDPVPRCYHGTFARSDVQGFMDDYEALLLDWYHVAPRVAYTIEHDPSEVSHLVRRGKFSAASRRAARREREAV